MLTMKVNIDGKGPLKPLCNIKERGFVFSLLATANFIRAIFIYFVNSQII